MTSPQFKHIYGPVHSWRIGMSLGVDPLADNKYCNFDCSYCQLGLTNKLSSERQVFVDAQAVADEVRMLSPEQSIDYITFSGNGEPTLAANLGEMITAVKDARPGTKVAIITNASTVMLPDVQADLRLADLVLFKLEAADQETFERINTPGPGIYLKDIIAGIKAFKPMFKGVLALQIMFTGVNKHQAEAIAQIAKEIGPDEVEINTPLRPSPIKPLSEEEMVEIKGSFVGQNVISVYEQEKKAYTPFDDSATQKRHGRFREKGSQG